MERQTYKNHRKYYPPHHFIYLPLLAVLELAGIYSIFTDRQNRLIWILFSIIIFLIFYLAVMVRQHYALGNQDRIVRLEFKLRYYEVFNERSDEIADKLSFDQIAALRFAYDNEFKELLDKALRENISGAEIKRSIKNWRPDHLRI